MAILISKLLSIGICACLNREYYVDRCLFADGLNVYLPLILYVLGLEICYFSILLFKSIAIKQNEAHISLLNPCNFQLALIVERRMATAEAKGESQDFLSSKRVRSANLSLLTKLHNGLERNMSSYDNKDHVKSLYNMLNDRLELFKSAYS